MLLEIRLQELVSILLISKSLRPKSEKKEMGFQVKDVVQGDHEKTGQLGVGIFPKI